MTQDEKCFKPTFCLSLATLNVGVGVLLLVDAEDAVDGVGGVPQGGVGLVAEASVEVRTGAAPAAVAGNLGFLCSFVPHNPQI